MKAKKSKRRKKLPLSVIMVSGIFCSIVGLFSYLAVQHIRVRSTPTLQNSALLLSRGKPREALALLDKTPKLMSSESRELVIRGKALFAILMDELRAERWGSYGRNPDNWISHPSAEEAERCFLDAMALSPDDPEIRVILGNLYREQGRFGDSEIMLRSALELDDADAEAFMALGLLYAEGNRIEAARRALAEAWKLDTGNPRIAKNIGYFYRFYVNVPESSLIWFSRFIDANPRRDPDINLIRAEMQELVERYPEFERYRREPSQQVNRGSVKDLPPPTQRFGRSRQQDVD